MTSNNETVSRQMPWAGNIVKTMTSNGKQFTVTREMLTAVARDRWNLGAVFKFCFCFVLLYNKSLNDWSLREQWILFPSNLNVSLDLVSGNKIHCSPRDQSLSVNYFTPTQDSLKDSVNSVARMAKVNRLTADSSKLRIFSLSAAFSSFSSWMFYRK